jgi:hypothetical protein
MLLAAEVSGKPDKAIINLDFPSLLCYYMSVGGYYG